MRRCFILIIGIIGMTLVLSGCSGKNSQLEESAKPIITQILKDNGFSQAECVKVKVKEKAADNFYKGTAVLSDGSEVNITIVDKGDQILVTVL